ncbi:MAG: AarF/ABC1/UbiB kinase family protein [Erysipelotrichia bacterium]|nr:AarF/ABC1/UbiB kinase family protein [Erysipelotrichia bacterium]
MVKRMQNSPLSSKKRLTQIITILRKHHITKGLDPVKLRMIIEDLGPTFVKIGQIMSTRQDMFSERYCRELTKLRSNVSPLSFMVIKVVIEQEYACPLEEVFSTFDEVPLGSASIAQVHYATLMNGQDVVVKVQRPNIYEMMERDISLLRKASGILHLSEVIGSVVDIDVVLDEFWQAAKQEMDFSVEAGYALRFKQTYKDIQYIDAPSIYREYTTTKVLVMEYIDGLAISEQSALQNLGYDCCEIAEKLAENYITQIVDHGFFHGDPHSGNIRIREGKIVWIDFGMMGILEHRDRELMKKAVQAIVLNDVGKLVDVILTLGIHDDKVDYPALLNDIENFMNQYLSLELSAIHLGEMVQDIFTICHKHRISMPKGVSMLARGMVSAESTLMHLDPNTNMIRIAANHMTNLRDIKLKKELKKIGRKLHDAGDRTLDIPVQLSDLIKMANRGQFKLNLNLMGSEEPIAKLDKMVNRIVICILAAALLMGSSLICTTDMTPKTFGIPTLGFIGYVGAMIMGLWLLFKMLKLHKKNK